jgi:tetratricopeptide (TPR) repeat protein
MLGFRKIYILLILSTILVVSGQSQQNSSYYIDKGIDLVNLGEFDDAIIAFDKAIELDPGCASAWNEKGLALYNLDKINESIEAYDRAIEIDPLYAYAWYNKGNALAQDKP